MAVKTNNTPLESESTIKQYIILHIIIRVKQDKVTATGTDSEHLLQHQAGSQLSHTKCTTNLKHGCRCPQVVTNRRPRPSLQHNKTAEPKTQVFYTSFFTTEVLFCSLKKGLTPKIHMLCFVIINSVLNLLCVWILSWIGAARPSVA